MLNTEMIAITLSQKHNIPLAELLSERKSNNVVPIRHECWYLAVRDTDQTVEEIGAFCNRHRSSIISGIAAHCKRNGLTDPRTGKDYGGGA